MCQPGWIMFSQAAADRCANAGSRVLSIAGGHWFVVSKRTREDFWRHLEDFLRETPTAPAPAPASGSFAAQNYDAPARL